MSLLAVGYTIAWPYLFERFVMLNNRSIFMKKLLYGRDKE